MQKFKIPLLIAGVILLAVILFLVFSGGSGPYKAIPNSAVAVIEVNTWDQFAGKLSTSATGSELKKTHAIQKLLSEIQLIRELLGSDASLKAAVGSSQTLASLHLISADDYDFLFTTVLAGVNDNTVLNRIQVSPKVRTVNIRIFKNQKIVDVFLKDGKQLSFAKQKDILSFSFIPFLTESAMTAILSGNDLGHDKSFSAVEGKLTTGKDLNLYFNFQKADVIFPVALKPERISQLGDLKTAGTWARYEVSFDNDKMELDGTVSTENGTATTGQDILNGNLFSKIPDHAVYVQLIRTDTGGNEIAKKYFKNWMGNTQAFAVLEPLKEDFTDQDVFVLSVNDKRRAMEDLKRLAGTDGAVVSAVDTFFAAEIYKLKDGELINRVFGNSLVTFKSPFFTVLNDAAIFCNNQDVLKLLLEKISRGETLDKDKDFLNTGFSHFGKNSAMTYLNFQRSDLLFRGMLKEHSSLAAFMASFKNVLAVSNANGKKTSSRLVFNAGGAGKVASGLLWKTKLQTSVVMAPQLVLNANTGEKEIFVQDTANTVYLIGSSGEILFTKSIDEPLLGRVAQLDYYNNGKLQYIFNSAHHIFIVDRLGNDVGSYPLRLSAAATGGLALVKSAANRYYVPCANGNIYGYEGNGRPLAGWSPRTGAGIISQSMQCFNNRGNDYVLAFNTTGKLMLFDAKGSLKWSVANLPLNAQGFSLVKMIDDFKILLASGNQLTEISSDGNDKMKPLIDPAAAFCAVAVSDSIYTYFFSTGGNIRAYGGKDDFQASANIAGSDISSMEILTWNEKPHLLICDNSSKQLFIYDTSLKPVASFNYTGANDFAVTDLFNQHQLNVLTPDATGTISCYRIR